MSAGDAPRLQPTRNTTIRPDANASHVHARKDSQHRDHGAHRRRQDDDDRAHPLLHGPDLQDRRGPRGRGRHGLDGAGAGARDHDHLRGHHVRVARPPDQHHRHAGPRRLHGRGRALAARARRRDRAVRLRRRRRATVRDRLASGRQVPRPAHRLHQQDGPHRGRLRAGRADDDRPPRARTRSRSSCRSAPSRTSAGSSTWSRTTRSSTRTSSARSRRSSRSRPSTSTRPRRRASTCSRRSPSTTTSCWR